MNVYKLQYQLNGFSPNDYWQRAVKAYAVELIEELIEHLEYEGKADSYNYVGTYIDRKYLLNGARDWRHYSYGGCSLIYDADIAKRFGRADLIDEDGFVNQINKYETWLDVQARALYAANVLIDNYAHGFIPNAPKGLYKEGAND